MSDGVMIYKGKPLKLKERRLPGVIGGPCAVFEAPDPISCESCGKPTTRVIEFLGVLEAQCWGLCGTGLMAKEEFDKLPKLSDADIVATARHKLV